ncbi:alkylation response protein AidB-like acyl-CoA dehydrogenase [Algoriphagus boseongensis]|uniref:Alkylation response protein AidB-like acyl-CoA dehydrogenase n=1 Tax=Algoriphagus boseongensis TaxID=1442587 RepID=A0A4R6T9G6_9BACT|nr:acyl-CoA dehydrogenase [Algoriphagus boseongensis]TDQ18512.1 alkylation response protein AidB-like acyl-CoA dehydrogenase [Algoriphagus boseongensis]
MNWNEIFFSEKAQEAEKSGRLPEDWLTEIYQEKWFKLFVPQSLEGLGLSLPEALNLEEKLAEWDGSLGWTVTLCAGAGWFVGFLEESLQKEVFSDPKVCLAGSGFVGGQADLIGDEYLVSGHWTYASGVLHSTHLTANCEILENGKPLLDKKGNPVIKAFILKRSEVEILDGWSYMGMIATGSHAFKAEKVRIPSNRCFEILPKHAKLTDSVFQYPFLQFAETTLAVNILGISQHLQRLISMTFWKRNEAKGYDKKHRHYFEKQEKKAKSRLEKAKERFYKEVNWSWEELEKKGKISRKTLNSVSRSSRKLTQTSREVNSKLYPFAGLEAAKTETELNRVWRDFNTVSQHALLIFPF